MAASLFRLAALACFLLGIWAGNACAQSVFPEELSQSQKWESLRGIFASREGQASPKYFPIRETGVNATTPFGIGSLSKQFTAATIVALERQGKLKRSDAACKYIEQLCPGTLGQITIEQLLRHKSGLRRTADSATARFWIILKAMFSGPSQTSSQLSPLAKLTERPLLPLDFDPGTKRSYSNLGFIALSAIIEKVSGVPVHQAMADLVFVPSGMKHTELRTFVQAPANSPPPSFTWQKKYILFGERSWQPEELLFDVRETFGAGAMQASAQDLLLWIEHLRAGKWPELLELDGEDYGLGLAQVTLGNKKWFWYDGAFEGLYARLSWNPRSTQSFVLLCNTSCDDAADKLFEELQK